MIACNDEQCVSYTYGTRKGNELMGKYSNEIVNSIREFLENDDWNFSFDSDKGVFRFGVSVGNRLKNVRCHILVHDDCYTVYAVSPIGPDEDNKEMMNNMSEFICRANFGLRNGNFEMDFMDGEIRYKTFVNCGNDVMPTSEIIKESIYTPVAMFDKYGSGITDIIFQDVAAAKAVAKCEGSDEEELQEVIEAITSGNGIDAQEMMKRLEARLGAIYPAEEVSNRSSNTSGEINTNMFGTKGGAK